MFISDVGASRALRTLQVLYLIILHLLLEASPEVEGKLGDGDVAEGQDEDREGVDIRAGEQTFLARMTWPEFSSCKPSAFKMNSCL